MTSAPVRTSWTELLQHYDALHAQARRHALHPADAQDVVHEALLSAQALPERPDNLAAWLHAVTRRLCADSYRRDRYQRMLALRLAVREDVPDDDVADEVCARAEALWVATQLRLLPPRQQVALMWRGDGLSVDEIAGLMAVPPKTVESLLSRARHTMRGLLAQPEGLPFLPGQRQPA